MPLTTAPGVFAARLREDFIFLDVAGDAYFSVLGDERNSGVSDPFSSLPTEQIEALIAAGLLVETVALLTPTVMPFWMRRRWRDLPRPSRRPRPGARDAIAFFKVHMATKRLLRGDSLVPAIAAARGLNGTTIGTAERVAAAVARFEELAIWLPRRGECVAHALALMHFLSLSGIATQWVFGVHLYPFRAHCWLVWEDYVVGDASHRVLAFTPIMAVGAAST